MFVLDTTMREGEQCQGVYFTPAQKLEIARALDSLGVDIIEVGNPSADPSIAQAIRSLARAGLRARIGAHSLCRVDHMDAALACGVGFLGVFLSVSERRLSSDYRLSMREALARIRQVVAHARGQSADVLLRFTPEDATRSKLEDVVEASAAAVEAGADIISLADSTGFMAPVPGARNLGTLVAEVKARLAARGLTPIIAVHCHNDRGLALANALQACQAGAGLIDASVLGLGERAGIVDLAALLVNLEELFPESARWKLEELPALYELVSKHARCTVPKTAPIVGEAAFTHYAGTHVRAVCRDPANFMSVEPGRVGKTWTLALGVQSGRSSIELALEQLGREDLIRRDAYVLAILDEVKELSRRGHSVSVDEDLPRIVQRVEKALSRRQEPARTPRRQSWLDLLVNEV